MRSPHINLLSVTFPEVFLDLHCRDTKNGAPALFFENPTTRGNYLERRFSKLDSELSHLPSIHLPPYPLSISFPTFDTPLLSHSRAQTRTHLDQPSPLPSIPMFSSLTTTSETATLFSAYATFVSECIRRKSDVVVGLDLDILRELGNDLWTLHDNFYNESDGLSVGDQETRNEDEE